MSFYLVEPFPEISTNVFEPITEQVVRYVLNRLGLSEIFGNRLYFNSTHETSSRTVDDDNNRPLKENRLFCTTTTLLDPRNVNWDTLNTFHMTAQQNELRKFRFKYPLFIDNRNKIALHTIELPTMMTIECEMKLVDRNLAYFVPTAMWNAFSNGDTLAVTDIMYDCPLPKSTTYLMYELFKLTEYHPGAKFIQYLKKGSDGAITLNINKNIQKHKQFVFNKTLHQVMLKLEFGDQNVNAEKNKKFPIKFNNTFSIIVQFSRPTDCYMNFPISINNNIVPKTFIPDYNYPKLPPKVSFYPDIPIYDFLRNNESLVKDNLLKFYSMSEIQAMISDDKVNHIVKEQWLMMRDEHVMRIPEYDNWVQWKPLHPYPDYYKPIAVLALTLEKDTDGEIINPSVIDLVPTLKDVLKLSDELIDKIKEYGNKLLFSGEEFHVQVYMDNHILDMSLIDFTNGVISISSTTKHMIHRIVFYIKAKEGTYGFVPVNRITIFDITAHRYVTAEG